MKAQISGDIGPFLDSVQQRQVPVVVVAKCTFARMSATGSDAELGQKVQDQLVAAIRAAVAPRMANGQLSFKDLMTGNTTSIIPEIIGMSGLAQIGIAIDMKAMSFGVDGRDPLPPLPADPPPPAPREQRVNVRVGGLNIRASSTGGVDTDGIKNQLIDRAKSTILWWLFGIGAVVVVVGGLGLYTYYVYKKGETTAPTHAATSPPPPSKAPPPAGKK